MMRENIRYSFRLPDGTREVFDFDLDFFRRGVQMVNPNAPLFVASCKTGAGMDDWVAWLVARCKVQS